MRTLKKENQADVKVVLERMAVSDNGHSIWSVCKGTRGLREVRILHGNKIRILVAKRWRIARLEPDGPDRTRPRLLLVGSPL